ncbi:MAG: hypothetical protein SNJ69_13965, partial [Chloroflexaceae bacterium]
MFRKFVSLPLVCAVVFALGLALLPTKPAAAQQGITWTTGFRVQNLGSAAANVVVQLYNPDGSNAGTINENINPNDGKTYFPVPNVSAGFQGSAVISADQQIAAILNVSGNNFAYNESVLGISQPSNTVRLPLIMRNNSGFSTWFAVQNAGTAAASVQVAFSPNPGAGNSFTTPSQNIPPGASVIFDQSTQSELGNLFVGSAIVTGNQPLAVVVNQTGTGSLKQLLAYSGFASGSNNVILPLVQQANAGFNTGISVQNSGTTDASVTVTYGPNLVTGGVSLANDTVTLQPGRSAVFLKSGTDRYVGSATVTTGAGQEVVVVVNQASSRSGTAYEGINSASATGRVSLPLLMSKNGGFDTGVQCRHLGTGTVNVTLTYTPNTVAGSSFNPPPETQS